MALGTARPSIDFEHRAEAVLLRAKHILQLDLLEEGHGRCVGRIYLLLGGDLLAVVLQGEAHLVHEALYLVVVAYPAAQLAYTAHLHLGTTTVLPEGRVGRA